jgi:hypothetical protein
MKAVQNLLLLCALGLVIAFDSAMADDLMPLGDEFEDPASISQWHRLNDVEGWNADQLEAWDVDTTAPGAMHVMPHTSSWFMDLRGVLVFKEITGDFVTTMRLNVLSRHNPGDPTEPPNRSFSLTGIFAHAPRGISSAAPTPYTTNSVWPPGDFGSDWQPDTDNYIFLSMGSAGNPGTRQCEVKTTLNGNSQLYYHSSGVSNSTEVTLQMVSDGGTVTGATDELRPDFQHVDRHESPGERRRPVSWREREHASGAGRVCGSSVRGE